MPGGCVAAQEACAGDRLRDMRAVAGRGRRRRSDCAWQNGIRGGTRVVACASGHRARIWYGTWRFAWRQHYTTYMPYRARRCQVVLAHDGAICTLLRAAGVIAHVLVAAALWVIARQFALRHCGLRRRLTVALRRNTCAAAGL